MYCWAGQMMGFWGLGWGMWFWLLIIGGAAYFFFITYRPRRDYYRETPLEIARNRYARGEITSEEFEEIKRNLEEK